MNKKKGHQKKFRVCIQKMMGANNFWSVKIFKGVKMGNEQKRSSKILPIHPKQR